MYIKGKGEKKKDGGFLCANRQVDSLALDTLSSPQSSSFVPYLYIPKVSVLKRMTVAMIVVSEGTCPNISAYPSGLGPIQGLIAMWSAK